MTARSRFSSLQNWNKTFRFDCPMCSEIVTLGKYRTEHCVVRHGIASDRKCAFCAGEQVFDRRVDYAHLHACLRQFLRARRSEQPVARNRRRASRTAESAPIEVRVSADVASRTAESAPIEVRVSADVASPSATVSVVATVTPRPDAPAESSSDDEPIELHFDGADEPVLVPRHCPCSAFDPRAEKAAHDEHWVRQSDKGMYDRLFEKPHWWREASVSFDEESGLGVQIPSIVQHFDKYRFFHVSVRTFAFDSFKTCMRRIESEIAVLPVWCLCNSFDRRYDVSEDGSENGGAEMESVDANVRHHRHMIVATKSPDAFRTEWKKIRPDPDARPWTARDARICTTFCKSIADRNHLINAMAYVSGRSSSGCNGRNLEAVLTARRDGEETRGEFHYFLAESWYPHARLHLSALFPGGVEAYVKSCNANKSITPWFELLESEWTENGHRKWFVRVRLTGLGISRCAIPLARDLECGEPAVGTLHLTNGDTLPVRRRTEAVAVERLERLTSDRRLFFAECVADGKYYLGRTQMRELTVAQSVAHSARREARAEVAGLRTELATARAEVARLRARLAEYESDSDDLET